jgi:hypothetical protein
MEDSITKKIRLIRKRSSSGEIHLIFQEARFDEDRKNEEDMDEAEIRTLMKKEASKPLLILREE